MVRLRCADPLEDRTDDGDAFVAIALAPCETHAIGLAVPPEIGKAAGENPDQSAGSVEDAPTTRALECIPSEPEDARGRGRAKPRLDVDLRARPERMRD